MRKFVIAVAVAAVLWTPEAASRQTILQKTDWRTKPFETYLPPPISVPGLDLDIRTKPPKLDAPFGWQANALPPYQLHRTVRPMRGYRQPQCWTWGGCSHVRAQMDQAGRAATAWDAARHRCEEADRRGSAMSDR